MIKNNIKKQCISWKLRGSQAFCFQPTIPPPTHTHTHTLPPTHKEILQGPLYEMTWYFTTTKSGI